MYIPLGKLVLFNHLLVVYDVNFVLKISFYNFSKNYIMMILEMLAPAKCLYFAWLSLGHTLGTFHWHGIFWNTLE